MEFNTNISAVLEQADSAGSQLKSVTSVEEAADTNPSFACLARCFSISIESTNTKRPLFLFGADSLIAVEPLHWYSTEIRIEITVVQIYGDVDCRAGQGRGENQ